MLRSRKRSQTKGKEGASQRQVNYERSLFPIATPGRCLVFQCFSCGTKLGFDATASSGAAVAPPVNTLEEYSRPDS